MDEDDIVDVSCFDVIAWLRKEMRPIVHEELEIARSITQVHESGR